MSKYFKKNLEIREVDKPTYDVLMDALDLYVTKHPSKRPIVVKLTSQLIVQFAFGSKPKGEFDNPER